MAKTSMIARENKRKHLVKKYNQKRKNLLLEYEKAESFEKKLIISEKLQKLPKNSSPQRLRNRCWKTGKPRGYFRFFGVCRNVVREMSHEGIFPGIIKASW